MSGDFDIVGDAQVVVQFQQAYAAAADLLFGIPVGEPIIVTVAQDKLLCDTAVKSIRNQKENQS